MPLRPAGGNRSGPATWRRGEATFATTTGEQHLIEIDLETKDQTNDYDFSGMVDGCRGLQNIHVYGECSGGGGALDFDMSGGPGSIEFVQ